MKSRALIAIFAIAAASIGVAALVILNRAENGGEIQGKSVPLRRADSLEGSIRPGERVLIESPQVRRVSWSTARAEFAVVCRSGRPGKLVVVLSELPVGLRYEWVVITGDANEHEALRSVPSIRAEVKSGGGDAANFAPVAGPTARFGRARVDFGFAPAPAVPVDRIALLVRDADINESYVLSAPRPTCERPLKTSKSERRTPWETYRDDIHGFSVRIPPGWRRAALDSNAADPIPLLELRAGPGRGGYCAPKGDKTLRRDAAEISVQERVDPQGDDRFVPRPAHFLPEDVDPNQQIPCPNHAPAVSIRGFTFFTAEKRSFVVFVAIGRDAPRRQRIEMFEILDSLRFEPA